MIALTKDGFCLGSARFLEVHSVFCDKFLFYHEDFTEFLRGAHGEMFAYICVFFCAVTLSFNLSHKVQNGEPIRHIKDLWLQLSTLFLLSNLPLLFADGRIQLAAMRRQFYSCFGNKRTNISTDKPVQNFLCFYFIIIFSQQPTLFDRSIVLVHKLF